MNIKFYKPLLPILIAAILFLLKDQIKFSPTQSQTTVQDQDRDSANNPKQITKTLITPPQQKEDEDKAFPRTRNQVKYFYNPKKSSYLIKHLERERGLKRTNNLYQENTLGMIIRYNSTKRLESQMMLRIQGTTKIGQREPFRIAMQQYDSKNLFKNYNSSFVNPQQYNINFDKKGVLTDEEKLILDSNLQGVYILKPSLGEMGKGINMIHDMKKLEEDIILKSQGKQPKNYKLSDVQLLQKYVENPLSVEKKKLDIRTFFSIVSTDPLIVLSHFGYTRKAIVEFDLYAQDQFGHVINGFVQEKHEKYKKKTVDRQTMNFDYNQFKFRVLKENPHLKDYDFFEMDQKMLAGITYTVLASQHHFEKKKGDIEIMAVDWVIDENLNPYMLEINNCPYLTPEQPVEVLQQVFPGIVADFLDAGLDLNVMSKEEIIERSRENPEFICKSAYRTNCNLLINEAANFNYIDSNSDIIDSWDLPQMQAVSRETILQELNKRQNQKKNTKSSTTQEN